MKIEVLISTMHQNSMDIFDNMNIKSDALAVNQYDYEYKEESISNNNIHRMISLNERGLSNSRNLAIRSSIADICVIADDDLIYRDNYVDIITHAYNKHPDADIIAFSVPSSNKEWPTKVLKYMNVNALQSMKLSSVQLTFRRERIIDHKIRFNAFFGSGSVYTCGEENIFLIECLKKGLKIIYIDSEIATVNQNGSTWFKGFDRLYFKTKGAMFYEMSKALWFPLILQFAIRKHKLYLSSLSLLTALKYMFLGRFEYKSILLKGKN
jgi:glycosyltransferase involved in cell wall biosynthesis